MKKYDVVALGEALIDYIPQDGKVCGQYRASVGGAPLNVSIGIANMVNFPANLVSPYP